MLHRMSNRDSFTDKWYTFLYYRSNQTSPPERRTHEKFLLTVLSLHVKARPSPGSDSWDRIFGVYTVFPSFSNVIGTIGTGFGYDIMTTTQPDIEKMEALIDEMSITIKNLASMATAHGLMNPYTNRFLHDAVDGDLASKQIDDVLTTLKKVNEGTVPEWSFLNVG